MSYQEEFISYLKPYAQAMEAKYGIDWRIIVTQAALETGWGKHSRSYNLWGMRFNGPAGQDSNGYALFHDQWEAIESYIYNVKKNHPTAWNVRNNFQEFFKEIQNPNPPNAGAWAEDPAYTRKLQQIFNQYFADLPTGVDSNSSPQVPNSNTAALNFPRTAERIRRQKDLEGAKIQQKRYYVKLQHIDADEEPQGALTIKISPDSQLLIVREKLSKAEQQGVSGENPENRSNMEGLTKEYSNVDKQFLVENSGSLQLQVDGVLLDFHDNAGLNTNQAQKITNQVQLRSDYLAILRVKEGKKKKSESILLGDDIIQIETNNDDKKSRIELYPKKILLKNADNDYIRIEEDTIQAKNKTESQIFMKQDVIVAENKSGSRVYLRGDYVQAKCKSGSMVEVTDDRVEAKNVSGCYVRLEGGNVTISAPGTVLITGSTVRIQGGVVYIN